MAKAIVHGEGESDDETFEGDISVGRIIRKDCQVTNRPVISLGNHIEIELTWDEAVTLWARLTGFAGREIIKGRVEDILNGKDTCHYCGAPYNAEASE